MKSEKKKNRTTLTFLNLNPSNNSLRSGVGNSRMWYFKLLLQFHKEYKHDNLNIWGSVAKFKIIFFINLKFINSSSFKVCTSCISEIKRKKEKDRSSKFTEQKLQRKKTLQTLATFFKKKLLTYLLLLETFRLLTPLCFKILNNYSQKQFFAV